MRIANLHVWIHSKKNLFIGIPLGLVIALTGTPAVSAERTQTTSENAGVQAASWFVTVPYGAVKTAFAIGGGIVGGVMWAATGGNTEMAKAVWIPSMAGDYVVQPQHLTGEKTLHFVGGPLDESASQQRSARNQGTQGVSP
jgi:hypothetical protein